MVTTLKRGTQVHVAGKVKGRNWYLVERDDKPLGYVYGKLLKDAETVRQEAEARRKEAQRKRAEETETALANSPPARPPTAHQCDRLAAHPSDLRRVGEGVVFGDISPDTAIAACQSAVGEFPGIPRFQYQLGRALHKGERYEDAIAWYRKAAEQGHASGQTDLGNMYWKGRGVEKDDNLAVEW